MKKIVTICLLGSLIFSVGCSSLSGGRPIEVVPINQGAMVGVNPTILDQAWGWCKDNPKMALTALGAGIYGGYKVCKQNDYFGLGDNNDNPSGVNTTTTLTHEKSYTVNVGNIGNDSQVNIYQVSPQTSTAP